MISTMFSLNEEGNFVEKLSILMNKCIGQEGRLEAATISDILYLFGQGNCVFIRENSVNFEK